MSPAALSTPANDTPARIVARAILSTLDAASAAFVLASLATFARAIVDAAALLRQCSGDTAEAIVRGMLDRAIDDASELGAAGPDTDRHRYAIAGAWWFETPCDVVTSFWRSAGARANVEEQARVALADVEALRGELGRARERVRSVDGLPFDAVAMPNGEVWVPAVEARASNDGGGVLPKVARVLYMTEPAAPGHTAIATGLAALTAGYATGEDATALVRGLAALAAHRAGEADDCRTVDGATAALAATLDALDAAALVGRSTLAAFDAAPPTAPPHSVEVRAA